MKKKRLDNSWVQRDLLYWGRFHKIIHWPFKSYSLDFGVKRKEKREKTRRAGELGAIDATEGEQPEKSTKGILQE